MTDTKAKNHWRDKLNLHVMLIMHQDGLSKADAQVRAYREGTAGLDSRAIPAPTKEATAKA